MQTFEGLYTCKKSDSLESVIHWFVTAEVKDQRVNNSRRMTCFSKFSQFDPRRDGRLFEGFDYTVLTITASTRMMAVGIIH